MRPWQSTASFRTQILVSIASKRRYLRVGQWRQLLMEKSFIRTAVVFTTMNPLARIPPMLCHLSGGGRLFQRGKSTGWPAILGGSIGVKWAISESLWVAILLGLSIRSRGLPPGASRKFERVRCCNYCLDYLIFVYLTLTPMFYQNHDIVDLILFISIHNYPCSEDGTNCATALADGDEHYIKNPVS